MEPATDIKGFTNEGVRLETEAIFSPWAALFPRMRNAWSLSCTVRGTTSRNTSMFNRSLKLPRYGRRQTVFVVDAVDNLLGQRAQFDEGTRWVGVLVVFRKAREARHLLAA